MHNFFYAKSSLMLVCPVSITCKLFIRHSYACYGNAVLLKKKNSEVSCNSCPIEIMIVIYNDIQRLYDER